jgi:hypothetical protein
MQPYFDARRPQTKFKNGRRPQFLFLKTRMTTSKKMEDDWEKMEDDHNKIKWKTTSKNK